MIDYQSLATITHDTGSQAAQRGFVPAVPTPTQIEAWKAGGDLGGHGFRFPTLGDYVPAGWELVDTYFVDISGFGTSSERAMTQSRLAKLIASRPATHGWALTEAWQFQGYVGEFRPVTAKSRPIESNQKAA